MCLRVGNLEVIRKEITKFEKSFLPANNYKSNINLLLDNVLSKVCDYIGFKLAFSDLARVFENLYVGDNTLAVGLQNLIEPFRIVCKKIPENKLPLVLQSIFKALVSAWMYYLLFFIPLHKAEELMALPKIIQNDQEFFDDFFIANDIENEGRGLTKEFMREEVAVINVIVQRLKQSDKELIEAYKNIESNKIYMKEIVVRVLYGRNSNEANQFFKLHANIILK